MILREFTDVQKYEICVKRDSRFDGVFWFGSRDSEVFCCPPCISSSRCHCIGRASASLLSIVIERIE
ncbi:Ada metal-binding domain-containing protein [Candidatus Methanomethylophilus sp. 1R26]|uniref:Ada metal-binding domain-containing protein n=1 Tax=Candidatus Methanomethylophilus sp. 1R26 TaxID=1769296 RepID=UPI0009EAB777